MVNSGARRWAGTLLVVFGVCALTASCGWLYQLAGYPKEVTRKEPPKGIHQREQVGEVAAAVRAPATLSNREDGTWEMRQGLVTLLVFYRGDW